MEQTAPFEVHLKTSLLIPDGFTSATDKIFGDKVGRKFPEKTLSA